MNVLNELNRPYIIDNLSQPLPLRHHWTFNAQQLDFMLAEISYLEETQGPTITLVIDDSEVKVPGAWNMLIVDRETYTVDVVPVTACTAFEHLAFVFSPEDGKLITAPIKVVNWDPKGVCVYPVIEKGQALVHAVTPGKLHGRVIPRGVVITPHDLYRYINGRTVGDILN